MMALILRGVQLWNGRVVDVRLRQGRIAALQASLSPEAGEEVIAAAGKLLLPGLWDHHLHLLGTAAARSSVTCGPPSVTSEQELEQALRLAVNPGGHWLRGVGYHESVCEHLDRRWLDNVCPSVPVRIQHRSGMLWVLNSRALELCGITDTDDLPDGAGCDSDGHPDGRFYNLDRWLGERLPRQLPDVRSLSAELASYGVVGVTDTGVNNTRETLKLLQQLSDSGELLQKVWMMGSEDLHGVLSGHEQVRPGPLKIYLREIDLPDFEQLVAQMQRAHQHLRAVAIHCVTLAELHFALAALAEAGSLEGDRIEHASIADDAAIERMQELGVTVVSQPHFIAERGVQYLQDVAADEQPLLYRAQSFYHQKVAFAAGSDAPYGDVNPWQAMAAAVSRRNHDGVVMGAEECLTVEQALAAYCGNPALPGSGMRLPAVGQAADLCLLNGDKAAVLHDPAAVSVALTLCAGQVIYRAPNFQQNGLSE
ncbi:amidohydrolase [Pseudomaricurvus sp. HS19]|uniref:amidohydrolase n=1 Tax=Pseudomaricurvus sp. HS19 TaxID=2692626 RepID=UPI00137162A1|nr:amidohydrolase family protein [Pseudomaricurvus sp. HS19]MYM64233.1 amidohydrolase family protein [Pseudomaricurvus sp. HS19]